ncbi:MAG: phage tail tape measure protein [Planctomycetes bacterium]|nr:phage tail tape measure protein [Planctomycetota bacterium]
MGAGAIKAGEAYVELSAKDSLNAALARAQKQLKDFGAAANVVGSGVQKAGVAVFGVGAAAIGAGSAAVAAFTHIGGKFADLSDSTGLSVELMSELETAIKDAGGTVEDFAGQSVKMQKAIFAANEGSTEMQASFSKLGLDFAKLKQLTPDQQFTEIAEAISKIQNPTDRMGAALQIFGKSASTLLPVLSGGASGLARFREESRQLGLSMSGGAARAADRLGTNFDILKDQVLRVAYSIGEALAPQQERFVEIMQSVVGTTINWIQKNNDVVVGVMKWAGIVASAGAGLIALGGAIKLVGVAATGLSTIGKIGGLFASVASMATGAISAIGSAIASVAIPMIAAIMSPIGLVIAGVIAAGAAFVYFSGIFSGVWQSVLDIGSSVVEDFKEIWKNVTGDANTAIGGITDALQAGDIALAGKIAMAGLQAIIQDVWIGIQKLWTKAIYSLAEAWEVIFSTVSDVFDRVVTAIKNAFSSAVSFVAKKIVEVTRFLGIDEIVLGVKLNDKEVEDMFKFIDTDTKRITDQRNKEVEQRSAQRERDLNDKIAALEAAYAADSTIDTSKLDAARKELKSLVDQAKQKKDDADATKHKPIAKPAFKSFDPEAVGATVSQVSHKLAFRGTFNAASAGGLLSSEDILNKIAESNKQTAMNTGKIADYLKNQAATQMRFG